MEYEKQLYLCLIESLHKPGESPAFKFMSAPIASSEREAKDIAKSEARLQYPEHAHLATVTHAYSFKPEAIERAAIEILGWSPPDKSPA